MIIETAAAFVSTISALSSIIKTVKSAKEITENAVTITNAIAKKLEPDNRSVKALAFTQIDDEYIKIATENIERARKRFIESWRDPSLPQSGKDQELEAASHTICSELKRLMKLNRGVLPGDDRFHELWANHNCS